MWGESSDSAFCPPPRGRRHLFFFCLLSHHFISYLFSFDTLFLHSFFSLHFYLDYSSPFCPSVFISSLFPPSLFSMPHNLFLIRTYLPCKQADCTANRILNVTMAGKNQPRADTAQQCEPWHDKCTPPMVWQITFFLLRGNICSTAIDFQEHFLPYNSILYLIYFANISKRITLSICNYLSWTKELRCKD